MPNIPITIPLEDDELLYSWMSRTAYANGFSHFRLFYNAYINPNASDSQKKRMIPQFELLSECEQIYASLSMENMWTLSEFFLKTGIYEFYAPLMMTEQQNDVLSVAFPDSFGASQNPYGKTKLISRLQYCPLCAEEDIAKTGHIIYRRSHHLPGVTACWKHKVSLIPYKGISLHETESVEFESQVFTASDYEVAYATFAKDFMNNASHFSHAHLKAIITKAIQKKQISADHLIEKYKNKLNGQLRFLLSPFESERYMNPINTIIILDELFHDASSIPTDDYQSRQKRCVKELHKLGCNPCEEYNPFLLQACTSDGKKWMANPNAVNESCKMFTSNNHTAQTPLDFTIMDNETLEKAIHELTGDEFSLVSNFKQMLTPVEMKHNVCGHIQKIRPSAFIEGKRCKYCKKMIRGEQLGYIVSSLSDGEYKIIAQRSTNRYALENTYTGKRIVLQKQMILQELRRPTSSLLLPLKNKGTEDKPSFDYEIFLEHINRTFPENEPVFTDELTGSGYSYAMSKRLMGTLTDKGLFERLAPGVYVRSGSNLSIDDIVHCRYINRHGKQIGYYTNASALHYFGVIDKPDSYSVATSKETENNIQGRTTQFLDHKLRIRGLQVKINDENWEKIMLLDLLSNFRKYLHSFDENVALSTLRRYVKEHEITYLALSKYIPLFPSSAKFVRKLYTEEQAYEEND